MTREEQIQEALKEGYSQEEINAYLDSIKPKPDFFAQEELNILDKTSDKPKQISPDFFTPEELNILNQTETPTETKPAEVPPSYFTKDELDILNQVPKEVPEEPELTEEDLTALAKFDETPSKYHGKDVDAEHVSFLERVKESAGQGIDSLRDVKTGWDLALGDVSEQEQEMIEAKAKSTAERLTTIPTLTAKDIQRIAEEDGLIPAGFLIPSYVLEQLLKSGPQMIGPILVSLGVTAAVAATGFLAPLALPAGLLAGVITYGAQQFGNFMNTQGLEAEAPEDLDIGQAAKWATLTAPVGFLADRFLFGLKIFPKKEIAKEVIKTLAARKTGGVVAGKIVEGGIKGFLAEAPTEVLETWAEFHQAGIDTNSEEAHEAYFEAFWAGGALGGTLGGSSRAYQGYKNHKKAQIQIEEYRIARAKAEKEGKDAKITRRSIIEDEKKAQKEETKRFKANQAKKGNLNTLDAGVFKLLGVKRTLAGAKKILGLDLNSVGNIDMAINFLERASEKKSTNSAAIKNYVAALKRKKNKLNKTKKVTKKTPAGTDVGGINIQPTVATDLDTLIQTKEGIDTVLNNMSTYFPNVTKKEMNIRRQELQKLKTNRIKIEDEKVAPKKVAPKTVAPTDKPPVKDNKFIRGDLDKDGQRIEEPRQTAPTYTDPNTGEVYEQRWDEVNQRMKYAQAPIDSTDSRNKKIFYGEPVNTNRLPKTTRTRKKLSKNNKYVRGNYNQDKKDLINNLLKEAGKFYGFDSKDVNADTIDGDLQKALIDEIDYHYRDVFDLQKEDGGKPSARDAYGQVSENLTEVTSDEDGNITSFKLEVDEITNTIKDLAPKQEVQDDTGQTKQSGVGAAGRGGGPEISGKSTATEDAQKTKELIGTSVDAIKSGAGRATGTEGRVDRTLDLPNRVKKANKLLRNIDPDNQVFPDYKETLKSPDITQEELTQIENDLKEVTKTKFLSKQKGKEGDKAIINALKSKKNIKQVLSTLLNKKNLLSPAQKELVQRIIALPNINTTKFNIVKNLEEDVGAYGTYDFQTNSIALSENAGIETILHEATHAATSNQLSKHVNVNNEGITDVGKQLVSLFNQAKEADVNNKFDDAFDSIDEFVAESFNNIRFQRFLSKIVSQDARNAMQAAEDYITGLNLYDKQLTNREIKHIKREFLTRYENEKPPSTGWANFISSVKNIIKGKKVHYSVLNDVISLAPELFVGPNIEQQAQNSQLVLFKKSKIKKQVEDNKSDRQKEIDRRRKSGLPLDDPTDNFPDKTPVSRTKKFITGASSYDAALSRAVRDQLNKDKATTEEIFEALIRMDIGQAVHASTLAQSFLENGTITYMDEKLKFEVTKGEFSMANLDTMIYDFARKHTGGDIKVAEEFIGQAFVALRQKFFKDRNRLESAEAQTLRNQGKDAAADKILERKVIVPETDAQLDELIKRFEEYPELNDIQDQWIGVKNSVLDVLLAEQVIDQAMYNELTEIVDVEGFTEALERDIFVPFYREQQPRTPREARAGTGTTSILRPIKGSFEPVANVFDNMEKFVRAGVTQAIINRTAREKVANALEYLPNDIKRVTQIPKDKEARDRTVEIHQHDENGNAERALYEFSDIFYAKAVKGVEKAMTVGSNMAVSASVFLRNAIVLNPIFSLAQTFVQDMHSAFFSSGLRYGVLTIPFRVAFEFPATILGLSKTHNYLKKHGAAGGEAWRQGEVAMENNINTPGAYNTFRRALATIPGIIDAKPIKIGQKRLSIGALLARIAMASDNSVRQAVYQQAKLEGRSEAYAIHASLEIINFRRVGSNKYITMGRSYIPFFGAAIQALSVQGKAIQGMVTKGGGVVPQDRATHTINFLAAWAQVAGMTLIYNMMKDDDDALETLTGIDSSDEAKKEFRDADPQLRDRRFIIGDSGFHITLRPDIFTYLAKILPEQIYQSMIEESQDARKFWDSLRRNAQEIVYLNLIPQLLRPMINMRYNFDPRTGRAIIPLSMQDRPKKEQYTAGTSEAAKLIGLITNTSPLYVDYFFRQYTGYLGGYGTLIIDEALFGADVLPQDRPDKSFRDAIADIPGMSNFMRTDKGNRFIVDLFELKAETTRVVRVFNHYEKTGWDSGKEAQEYLDEGDNRKLYNANKSVVKMMDTLKKLRIEEKLILDAPKSFLDGEEKKAMLDLMHEQKLDALQHILEIRKEVYGVNPFEGWKDFFYKDKGDNKTEKEN